MAVKKLTLRDLFHMLANKHYVPILVSGSIKDCLKYMRDNPKTPLEYKEGIEKAVRDLENIEKRTKEADAILNKVKKAVYEKMNPDEAQFDMESP